MIPSREGCPTGRVGKIYICILPTTQIIVLHPRSPELARAAVPKPGSFPAVAENCYLGDRARAVHGGRVQQEPQGAGARGGEMPCDALVAVDRAAVQKLEGGAGHGDILRYGAHPSAFSHDHDAAQADEFIRESGVVDYDPRDCFLPREVNLYLRSLSAVSSTLQKVRGLPSVMRGASRPLWLAEARREEGGSGRAEAGAREIKSW